MSASDIIVTWPEESRGAAQQVIDTYGEPDQVCESWLTWFHVGPWKRVTAAETGYEHNFPAPHTDSVQSYIDYHVPAKYLSAIAEFDGSVLVERTAGEVSARCHDIGTNALALNLMHDIVTEHKTVNEARLHYAQEFLDARRNNPTAYMKRLRFSPQAASAGDPDHRALTDTELERAARVGETAL